MRTLKCSQCRRNMPHRFTSFFKTLETCSVLVSGFPPLLVNIDVLQEKGYRTYMDFASIHGAPPYTVQASHLAFTSGSAAFILYLVRTQLKGTYTKELLYAVFMFSMMVINCTGAILLSRQTITRLESILDNNMLKGIPLVYQQPFYLHPQLLEQWDFVQANMLCCGVNGYEDYYIKTNRTITSMLGKLPWSCCSLRKLANGLVTTRNMEMCQKHADINVFYSNYLHIHGCRYPFTSWLAEQCDKFSHGFFIQVILQTIGLAALTTVSISRYIAGFPGSHYLHNKIHVHIA